MIRFSALAFAALLAAGPAIAQTPPSAVQKVIASAKYKDAVAFVSRDHDRIVQETIRLTEIPAPPFKEAAKARAYLELMRQYGLADVQIDQEGNVIGSRKGAGGPLLVVSAHLDTVFPEGTPVKVKREGNRLLAPGVGDDTRGLAVMLAVIRAFDAAKIETASDILFVASVGEEGLGDLRGMKYLFLKGPYKDKIKTFIGLDGGTPQRIATTALGSKRYRLSFSGPGGHSYGAFGTVNPMYAMGGFLTQFATTKVPPRTSYSAGVIGGGTSVNAIPNDSWVEIDMRSASPEELSKLESRMKDLAMASVAAENRARSTANGMITLKIDLVGDRPAGSMGQPLSGVKQPGEENLPVTVKDGKQLVATVAEAITAHGLKPEFEAGSTDGNVAMSIGIPAITMAPGVSGRAHALDEFSDATKDVSERQIGIIMTTILATAGMRTD